MKKLLVFLLWAMPAFSQAVPVSLVPIPMPFLYVNGPLAGGPLAFGCIFTYATGTSTPLGTYTDNSGLTLNPNPTVLNAGGFAQLWFQSGLIYDIKIVSSGGTNCVSGNTQYTVKGINTSLLNLANIWQQPQTFSDPIAITASDLQIVFGQTNSQTTLDIPPTPGNVTLHGPTIAASDTLVSENAQQTLTLKTLNNPVVNGVQMTYGPGTYITLPNSSSGTVQYTLTKITSAGQAQEVSTSDTSGVIGICILNCGNTGTATIIESGATNCFFIASPTPGDYVTIDSGVEGYCHDAGALYPTSGQVIGQADVNGVILFSPGIQIPTSGGQTSPVASIVGGAGAGSGGVAACSPGQTCLDNGGIILVTTGTSPTAGGTVFTVTYHVGNLYSAANCSISPASQPSGTTPGNEVFVLNTFPLTIAAGSTGLNATTNYVYSYTCNFR